MSKAPGGGFEVTVDGFPALKCHAASSDEALSLTSHALERLEIEGAAVPNRGIYSWEEYVSGGLCPIGKMAFADLPSGQRFLRENFPTMWDKLSSTTACPLPSEGEPTQIPAAEIVWHHVWALSDELTPSERQERLSWSGNPNLHF
ncbi:hypothetical protein EV701_109119 [Chthoniobacter flavus]|nr:hypothetical protein [Chthoniobacter flavus]TCO90969.1 hypothetical protein EV701_109119 [Chthoniobacter flavus]